MHFDADNVRKTNMSFWQICSAYQLLGLMCLPI